MVALTYSTKKDYKIKDSAHSGIESIVEGEQLEDEFGNLIINIVYYGPQTAAVTTKKPQIAWDYNLGRTTSIQGFFSSYAPDTVVVGSTLSPEKTRFVIAHEFEHLKRHRTNQNQDEYSVDIAAKKVVGHDPYNRWGYNTN